MARLRSRTMTFDPRPARPEPMAASAPADGARLPPDDWAPICGEAMKVRALSGKRVVQLGWRHAAASALHGWAEHRRQTGAPIRIARGDYEAALAAASQQVSGRYVPHMPALSEHAPHYHEFAPEKTEPVPARLSEET